MTQDTQEERQSWMAVRIAEEQAQRAMKVRITLIISVSVVLVLGMLLGFSVLHDRHARAMHAMGSHRCMIVGSDFTQWCKDGQ